MKGQPPENDALGAIRHEIDLIDDQLVDLLMRRIEASERVKMLKGNGAGLSSSALRPAREALIARRLVERAKGRLSPQFLVRLWRIILSHSTLIQTDVAVHVPAAVARNVVLRLMIHDHFGAMRIVEHETVDQCFRALVKDPRHLCVVETASNWADVEKEGLQAIGAIPAFDSSGVPPLLTFGNVPVQPTGDDQTLVAGNMPLSRTDGLTVNWQAASGAAHIAALQGFLDQGDDRLGKRGLTIVGRYPTPLKVRS